MTKTLISLLAAATLLFGGASLAQDGDETQAHEEFRSIDQEVQDLKKEVLDLNRDLFLLEEELLFPANSQVAFFISMDVGEYFELDSVNIKIDGKEVANYLYTEREVGALARGGVHDLHGPAGTCALFNVSVLHTATTRPTQAIRKTAQIYYGHRDRAPLANDSGIPATLWRDHPDAETRAFYGVLNQRTKMYMAAFG